MMLKLTASLSIVAVAFAAVPATGQSPSDREQQLAATAAMLNIQRQAVRHQSQELMNKALEARSQGRLSDALSLACDAASADPSNAPAQSLKQDLQTLVVGTSSPMLNRELARLSIQSQIQAEARVSTESNGSKEPSGEKNSGKGAVMSENKSGDARKTTKMPIPSESDLEIIQRQKSIRERMDREYEHQINDADEKLIPFRELVNYPPDWAERSEMRDRATREQRLPIGQ